jgi:hypothetical protein
MSRGNITIRRGRRHLWQAPDQGNRQDAQRELTRLLAATYAGTHRMQRKLDWSFISYCRSV